MAVQSKEPDSVVTKADTADEPKKRGRPKGTKVPRVTTIKFDRPVAVKLLTPLAKSTHHPQSPQIFRMKLFGPGEPRTSR